MKALEPLRIIPSKDGVPYAYQTKLGWRIVEPIQNDEHQNLVKCNRVLVKEASTSKLARDRFHIENADKDMSIENMFAQMYYQGFNEKGTQIGKIDGNVEQLSRRMKRGFWKFWMQAQGRMRTNMRYHCHSNRKASKSQITEVKL